MVPAIEGMKDTYVDVKTVLANGKHVIVEMQVLNVQGFEQRILYNAAKNYSLQLAKGQDYTLLNPVIALTLTDFVMFPEAVEHVSRFKLLEQHRFTNYTDDLELVFVELPKFGKTEDQLAAIDEFWLYFVGHSGTMDRVPPRFAADPALRQAFELTEESKLSLAGLEMQHRRFDFVRRQRAVLKKAADAEANLAQAEAHWAQAEAIAAQAEANAAQPEGKAETEQALLAHCIANGMTEAAARAMLGV
ncbi:MAG: Rpn family recombination-promoting nuclease/putative transposase [Myxococcales bacterium]|nr:Rpn family recombination-promoting nuclease/putative transposase [Myxococcales bacterium]